MAKVEYSVKVYIDVEEATPELLKVAGREVIAGINTSLDHNQNVTDITVTDVNATVALSVDCMPDEEIGELAQ